MLRCGIEKKLAPPPTAANKPKAAGPQLDKAKLQGAIGDAIKKQVGAQAKPVAAPKADDKK